MDLKQNGDDRGRVSEPEDELFITYSILRTEGKKQRMELRMSETSKYLTYVWLEFQEERTVQEKNLKPGANIFQIQWNDTLLHSRISAPPNRIDLKKPRPWTIIERKNQRIKENLENGQKKQAFVHRSDDALVEVRK